MLASCASGLAFPQCKCCSDVGNVSSGGPESTEWDGQWPSGTITCLLFNGFRVLICSRRDPSGLREKASFLLSGTSIRQP